MAAIAFFLAISILSSPAIAQTIYKWKDEKGQWHFSQTPPAERKTEKVDLPSEEGRDLKTRAEWQRFYAPFREAKYRMDRPNPHTHGLKGLLGISRICHVHESLSNMILAAGKREEAAERRESARACAQEAQAVFPIVLERAQKELSQKRPSAVEKLRSLGGAWLAAIRAVPRVERPELLSRKQEEDRKLLDQKEAELDMDLL